MHKMKRVLQQTLPPHFCLFLRAYGISIAGVHGVGKGMFRKKSGTTTQTSLWWTSSEKQRNDLLRCFIFIVEHLHIWVEAVYLPGKEEQADALVRNKISIFLFRSICSQTSIQLSSKALVLLVDPSLGRNKTATFCFYLKKLVSAPALVLAHTTQLQAYSEGTHGLQEIRSSG